MTLKLDVFHLPFHLPSLSVKSSRFPAFPIFISPSLSHYIVSLPVFNLSFSLVLIATIAC